MLRAVLIFAMVLFFPLVAAAQGGSADIADIKALHEARLAAILKGDFDYLDRLLSDDFVVTFPNGTVGGKAEYLGGQRSGKIVMTASTHDQERFKIYGDAAVITGRSTLTLQVNGKEQPLVIRYTHTYAKQDGQWRMVVQHSTPISK